MAEFDRARRPTVFLTLCTTGALLLSASEIPADGPPDGSVVAAESAAANVRVEHLTERTVADAGRTRVIAFHVVPAPAENLVLDATVTDSSVLEIAREATVAAGRSIGYVRVRGLREGASKLLIDGAPIDVRVTAGRGPADRRQLEPRIIGPATGAFVWGTVSVGIETRYQPGRPLRRIVLRMPDGELLESVEDTRERFHPYRQLRFELNVQARPDGRLDLTPVALGDDDTVQTGPPVTVTVVHPEPRSIVAGEAETDYEVERPPRFQDDRRPIGHHRDASGGTYFANASAQPAVCFPVRVQEAGWYQVMLVASGTRAQGALPTVGVVVDGGNVSRTNGRVLGKDWHRFAAGVPIRLEPGERVLTPFFANDFFVPSLADRNLLLDRIEVARLAGSADDDEASRPGMGGMGGMHPAMAANPVGGMNSGGEAVSDDDPFGLSSTALRLGLTKVLDGATIGGLIEIEGRCWWVNERSSIAPTVTLVINGRAVERQRSGAPRFWVDPSQFVAGPNQVQLVAMLDDGTTARTPVQVMHRPAAAHQAPARLRRHWRFSIHESGWDPRIRSLLGNAHNPKERRAAVLSAAGELELRLPDELAGGFKVFLECLGEHFEGPPIATLYIRTDDDQREIGAVDARTWWNDRFVGEIDLAPGPKRLVVAFENDRFEPDVGDRNLLFQAVILARKPEAPDRTPPTVEIMYPADGQAMFMADAVVARAADDASLASAELLLDGGATGLNVPLNLRPGDVVMPLLLRGVEPGEHEVAVRVLDVAGNSTISEPRTILVQADPPVVRGPYERAVRLLNRFGFGPDPRSLGVVLTTGEAAWLEDQLSRPLDDAGDLAALGAYFPYFVNRNNYEVPRRALAHALLTPNPVRTRFVLWAENHFSTWIRKVQGDRKWTEHIAFARLGPAPFDQLLFASAESPAMLAYLDQEQSFAGRLNENYAREVMELHTVGVHGGYSQDDVTSLARLLTGWTASFEGDGRGGGANARVYTFRYDPALNDGRPQQVLGMMFPSARRAERYDRSRLALEMLASHPSTARYISRKLAEHYVANPAPDDLVDDLARTFLATGGDMSALLRAIAAHPAFQDGEGSDRVTDALGYALRLCRTTGHVQPWLIGDYLQRSGYGMFDCSTPDGYPQEDAAYTNSNALIQRWRLARDMLWPLASLVPPGWRYRQDVPEPVWSQLVVDVIAVRLTGRVLRESSNAAALELLRVAEGNRDERIQQLAPFIAQLPEANLH